MQFIIDSALFLVCLITSVTVIGQNEKLISVYSKSNYFEGEFASTLKSKYRYDSRGNLIEEIKYSTYVDSTSFEVIKRKELEYTRSGLIKEERYFTSYSSPERLEGEIDYFYINDTLIRKDEIYYDREEVPISEKFSYYNAETGKLDSTITIRFPHLQFGRKEVFHYTDLRTEISIYLLYEDEWWLYNVEVKLYNQNNQLESYSFKYDDWSAELLYEYEYDLNGRIETFKFKRGIPGTNQYELSYQSDCENMYGNEDEIIETDCYYNQLLNGSVIGSFNINTQFDYYCDGPLRKKTVYEGRKFDSEEIYNYSESYECPPNHELNLKVYPNPVSSLLFLESELLGYSNAIYGVYDITGKEVIDIDFNLRESLIEIDVSYIPLGIYVVKLFDGQEIKAIQFMKK